MDSKTNTINQKTKKSFKNFFFGILGQLIVLSLGIVVLKLVIKIYGSETNGLLDTLNQIFSFVALIEAGIGGATVNVLYLYIVRNDKKTINDILSASRKFFKRAAFFYILVVIITAFLYPLIAKTSINYWTIFFLIIIEGSTGVLPYLTYAPFSMLLQAEGHNYVITNILLLANIVLSVCKIGLYLLNVNILVVQFVYFIVMVLECLVFMLYQHRKYEWVLFSKDVDMSLLKGKGSFVFAQIAQTIFSSTDIILISIFTGMGTASVYSVYAIIFNSLQSIINIFVSSTIFSLGQAYHEGFDRYLKLHDALEAMISNVTFCIISTACILTIPFITLYTKNITDINYIDPLLPFLFSIIILLYIPRSVCQTLLNVSGHVKRIAVESFIEMFVNIICSIVLVLYFGMEGTLIATIMSLLLSTNDLYIFANSKILKRKPTKVYLLLLVDFAVFAGLQICAHFVNLIVDNYLAWFFEAVIIFLINIICYILVMVTLNHSESIFLFSSFKTFLSSRKKKIEKEATKNNK